MQPVRAALRYSYHRMNFYRSIILAFPANYNGNICDIRRGRSQKKRRGFVRFDEGGLYDERSAGGRRMRAAGPVILFSEYIFQRGSFILPSRSTFPHYYFRAEGAEVICAMFFAGTGGSLTGSLPFFCAAPPSRPGKAGTHGRRSTACCASSLPPRSYPPPPDRPGACGQTNPPAEPPAH